ncbi:hypothetical protein [Streptomyces sp. NPDC050145]|uniref:hypothetical protein n=1 Tax=Streptomyces sp. NPDC050145 TaxID=3365602 RepID=UPI003788CEEA
MTSVDRLIEAVLQQVRGSGMLEAGAMMGVVTAVGSDGTATVSRGSDIFPRVRLLAGDVPAVGDRVELLRTAGGWVCLGALRRNSAPRVQSGTSSTPGGTANAWSTVNVTFPTPFPTTPTVVATPRFSTTTATTYMLAVVYNESPTGFQLKVWRTTTAGTDCNWVATTY